MKKIIEIIMCLLLFACNKDDKDSFSDSQHNKEIQKAILGKWRFHSLSQGATKIETLECEEKSTIEFTTDWRYIYTDSCKGKGYQSKYYTGTTLYLDKETQWVEVDSNIVIWADYLFLIAPGNLRIEYCDKNKLTLSTGYSSATYEDRYFTTYKRVK